MSGSKPHRPTAAQRAAAEADPSAPAGDDKRTATAPSGQPGTVGRLTDADAHVRPSRPFVQNLGIVVGAFAGGTVIAEIAGAANLGTAMSFGQIAFALALVYVLIRR